ncbi:HpcH/HpaI aldolase/citrate lyase family protein [Peribacillus butanolivorans]|uniref:HpcH/HpaI aldolase/citrate lyase family protein n=1 Tax=Peribacillus butanolivorans TaxID=421767 RepID=UPI0035DAB5E9
MLERSYLFVPGIKKRMIEKALLSESDIVIIDLEDAVAEDEKENARNILQDVLNNDLNKKKVIVRINALNTPYWQQDLQEVLTSKASGIVLPKAENAEDIESVCKFIECYEGKDEFEVIPLIESAKGVYYALEIAQAHSYVKRLAFGSVDYSLDVGATLTSTGLELLYARSAIVVASKVAGIESPIDSVFMDIQNLTGFEAEIIRAKELGFKAKLLIHPSQIASVNSLFSPSKVEIVNALGIVRVFEESLEQGIAAVSYEGSLIDYPVYKKSKELIEFYNRNGVGIHD